MYKEISRGRLCDPAFSLLFAPILVAFFSPTRGGWMKSENGHKSKKGYCGGIEAGKSLCSSARARTFFSSKMLPMVFDLRELILALKESRLTSPILFADFGGRVAVFRHLMSDAVAALEVVFVCRCLVFARVAVVFGWTASGTVSSSCRLWQAEVVPTRKLAAV